MVTKEEKFACESCIRGHRVAQCQHTADAKTCNETAHFYGRESSTPSTALSPPGFEPKPLELAPLPLRSTSTERLAPAHCSAGSILGSSLPSVNNWSLDDMPIAWTTPLESYLPDSVLSDIHDPTRTGDSVPIMGAIEQAQMSRPTFDDPLSTVDILGLDDLFIEADAGQMLALDNSNLLDFQMTTCYDHGQWFDNYDFMNS
ncbi:transcription activator CUP2 [Fusarium beomiforme]|uniref:Transcription activator CUP2 n=1 Tax=Fusarium beomiforme TaxID=44412 RepID=A0A9P5A6W8_9HYPO|nr:transcription activator CUP2 [Fusarium beomiforme]